MSQQNEKEDADEGTQFLDDVFPSSEALLSFTPKGIELVATACLVSLDANVLLVPYKMENRYFDKVTAIYQTLADAGRLYIAGQAVREYMKHRVKKISEIYQYIDQQSKKVSLLEKPISLLDNDPNYVASKGIAAEINRLSLQMGEKLAEVKSSLRKSDVDVILKSYRAIFASRIIEYDFKGRKKDFQDELKRRYEQKRPPGYKDKGKPDSGYGDLLIWKTLLASPAIDKQDMIFVTGEEKSDWFIRQSGPFALRPELVDEYRAASNGGTLHVLDLPAFLKLFKADNDTVTDASKAQSLAKEDSEIFLKSELVGEMLRLQNYVDLSTENIDRLGSSDPATVLVRNEFEKRRQEAFSQLMKLSKALNQGRYINDR